VCCTLSGAGSQPILEVVMHITGFKFDAVIIDEAAQVRLYLYMYMYKNINIFIHIFIPKYIYIRMFVYIYMYIYKYTQKSQAVEPSTLIPFKFNPARVVMVGDPCQLPATVFSRVSKECNYDQSLFQRLRLAGHPVLMLETQYR
jgi:superfamily I DNA and/or RNA helicase